MLLFGVSCRKAWPLQDSTYLVNGQAGVEDGDMGRFQMVIGDRLTGSWNSFPLDDMEQCWTFRTEGVVCFILRQ